MDALEDLLHFVPRLCNSVAHLLDHSAKETEEPYIWLEECPAKILLDKKRFSQLKNKQAFMQSRHEA